MEEQKDLDSLKDRVNVLKSQNLSGTNTSTTTNDEKANGPGEKVGAPQKTVNPRERRSGEEKESPKGPIGLDVGTSHVVVAQNKRNHIETIQELNAFFTVPNAKFARDILGQKEVSYFDREDQYYIFGYSAESFANMFNAETRRPMKDGFLSPDEEEGIAVIQAIANTIIQKPKNIGEILCFAVPADPLNGTGSVVYHESVIKKFIGSTGYSPVSINEAMAVVLAELSEDDYTGIGISMGGGMCNVCLSYLSFPVITYSLQMAGDYIDKMVGTAVGEPATKIKVIKEEELDLTREPKDRVMTALHIFYDEMIFKLLESLQRVLNATENIPKIKAPVPIVLSGGTAMPEGCKEKFEKMLNNVRLPLEISSVRLSDDPLSTPAKGALLMAMTEAE